MRNKVIDVSIPVELSYVKTREVLARNQHFTVPQGIVRIDIEKGKRGTRGWQVRPQKFIERPSKFFSDSLDGHDYGPADSLFRALEYLRRNPPGVQVRKYPNNRAAMPTGFHGIRVCVKQRRDRKFKEVYVEASNIERGKASRRFYCGTDVTTNEDRVAAGIEKALKARLLMEHQLLERREHEVKEALHKAKVRDLALYNASSQATSEKKANSETVSVFQ